MPVFSLTVLEPLRTVRRYEFERKFKNINAACLYLQKIADSGQIPDDVQEEHNELVYESEYTSAPINGAAEYPGICGTLTDEGIDFEQTPYTGDQLAFCWKIVGGNVVTQQLEHGVRAISGNILIARPAKSQGWVIAWPGIGAQFEHNGNTWEVLFAFESPVG